MAKTALITGASGGIGYEFAQELAADGYNLVLVARSTAKLEEIQTNLTQKYPITVKVLAKDLSLPESVPAIFNQLESEKIVVDVLINNAGFGNFGEFTASEWQKEADMLQVNIFALTHLTKLFVKGMVARRQGKILNVASTAAFKLLSI
jgi:short-subunit dehydrogenase